MKHYLAGASISLMFTMFAAMLITCAQNKRSTYIKTCCYIA